MLHGRLGVFCAALLAWGGCSGPARPVDGNVVALPGAHGSIPWDDLWYSFSLGKVVAAAGGTGNIDLVDADSLEVTALSGMNDGAESAADGGGFVFVADRSKHALLVIDPAKNTVVG